MNKIQHNILEDKIMEAEYEYHDEFKVVKMNTRRGKITYSHAMIDSENIVHSASNDSHLLWVKSRHWNHAFNLGHLKARES